MIVSPLNALGNLLNLLFREYILFLTISTPMSTSPGQRLSINAETKTTEEKPVELTITSKIHIVKKGENLTAISNRYNIPIKKIVEMNNLSHPNSISPGLELSLIEEAKPIVASTQNPREKKKLPKDIATKENPPFWKKYGPLQVDWSNWDSKNDGYIAPSIHQNGNSFYLAINCSVRRINVSNPNGSWKRWMAPMDKFEYDLVSDVCDSKEGINNQNKT